MTTAHNLVPQFILDKYAAGETSGRFDAFVLFADVSGFSQISSALAEHGQHGAEVLSGLMRAVFDPLQQAIADHGGFITTSAGDAATAVFPDDDGQAALAAAWAIRNHVLANSEQQTPYGAFPIGVKLGLSQGTVNWGIVAANSGARAAYYFYGEAIDAAAGAEKHARQNAVVIAPAAVEVLGKTADGEIEDGHLHVVSVPQPALVAADLAQYADQTGQGTRLDQDVFFPQAVLALPALGEFRQSVNVFINLHGTPDEAHLAEFMAVVFALQDKYGGVLNSVDFGDKGCKLLLFWGAPVSYENDVSRALDFLLELQDESALRIKAGVTLRAGFAGFVGASLHEEYTCFGHGVSLAARLMSGAPWDSIWLDEPAGELASGTFEIEYEEHFALKGFGETQAAYVLLDRRAFDAGAIFTGEIVGREAELVQLQSFVAPLLDSTSAERFAGLLVVTGEAGLGKSRLVHDIQRELAQNVTEPPQFFVCQTDEVSGTSLNPFRYWLRDYLGQSVQQSEARNKRAFSRKLRQIVAATEGELAQVLEDGQSFLGALIDLHWENSRYARFDPQARFANTLRALRALILAESLRRPTVLVIEDTHWLDDDSREFLRELTRAVDRYPLAVVATSRPVDDDLLPAIAGREVELLALTDLASSSLAALAQSTLAGPVADELVGLLAERAGGNPFHAGQLLLYLRDAGLLSQSDRGWMPSSEARDPARLPSNVRHVFTARLDQMPPKVRDMLQVASIFGREFGVQVLERVVEPNGALADRLTAAEQASIVTPVSGKRYLFQHALLRDTAYEMQAQSRRRELHMRAGKAYEALYAENLEVACPTLARHFEASCKLGLDAARDKARFYLLRAGEEAAEAYENSSAVDYFSRALDMAPDDDSQVRYDILLRREQVYAWKEDREAQQADLAELAVLADAANDNSMRAEVGIRRSRYGMEVRDLRASVAAASSAYVHAFAAGDVERQAWSKRRWGEALWRQGELAEAAIQLRSAKQLAVGAGNRQIEGEAVRMLGVVELYSGDPAIAMTVFEQARAICEQINDLQGEHNNLNNWAVAASYAGLLDKALTGYEQALELTRVFGRRWLERVTLGNLARLALFVGKLDSAREWIEQLLILAGEADDASHSAGGLLDKARLHMVEGEYRAAHESAVEAARMFERTDDWEAARYFLPLLAETLIALGRTTEAAETYQQVLDQAHERDLRPLAALAHAGLAEAALINRDFEESLRHTVKLLPLLESESMAPEMGTHMAKLFAVAYSVLHATEQPQAADVLRAGHTRLQADALLIEDASVRATFLEQVPENRELAEIAARKLKGDPGAEVDLNDIARTLAGSAPSSSPPAGAAAIGVSAVTPSISEATEEAQVDEAQVEQVASTAITGTHSHCAARS